MITAATSLIVCWIVRSVIASNLATFIDDNNPNQTEGQAYRNAKYCDGVATNSAILLWIILLFVTQ